MAVEWVLIEQDKRALMQWKEYSKGHMKHSHSFADETTQDVQQIEWDEEMGR